MKRKSCSVEEMGFKNLMTYIRNRVRGIFSWHSWQKIIFHFMAVYLIFCTYFNNTNMLPPEIIFTEFWLREMNKTILILLLQWLLCFNLVTCKIEHPLKESHRIWYFQILPICGRGLMCESQWSLILIIICAVMPIIIPDFLPSA